MSYNSHRNHQLKDVTVNFDTGTGTTLWTPPAKTLIARVNVEVTETWDDGSPEFEVGDAGDPDGFIKDIGNELGVIGFYNLDHDTWGAYLWHLAGSHRREHIYPAPTPIIYTGDGNGDGGTQGIAVVHFLWRTM